jgi:Zn-dependent protease
MYSLPMTEWWDAQPTEQKALYVALLFLLLAGIGLLIPTDASLTPLVAIVMVVLIAFPLHEFVHAMVAVWLGDETPWQMGRCTLNPLAHIDPLGAILLIFAGFGWARPVRWNPRNLKINKRVGIALVALAGPISNLLLATISHTCVQHLDPTQGGVTANLVYTLNMFTAMNVSLFVFNLLPAPPLDGSHILLALMPGDMFIVRRLFEQYGAIFLLTVIMFGSQIVAPITALILAQGFGLS